jgi:hypothetical protein
VLSDVVIEAAEHTNVPSEQALQIPAHRAILAGASEMLMKLMTQGVASGVSRDPVIRINGYPPQTVLQVRKSPACTPRPSLLTCLPRRARARSYWSSATEAARGYR